jgi:hypothetical protein
MYNQETSSASIPETFEFIKENSNVSFIETVDTKKVLERHDLFKLSQISPRAKLIPNNFLIKC